MCFSREYVTLSDFEKTSQVTYTCSLRIWGTLILVEYFSSLLGTNMCDRHRLWGWLGPWSPSLDIRTIPSTRAVPPQAGAPGGHGPQGQARGPVPGKNAELGKALGRAPLWAPAGR